MALRSGVRFFLVLMGLAVVMFMIGVALLAFLFSRGPQVPEGATLVIRTGGDLQEAASGDVLEQLLNRDAATVRGVVDTLRKAQRDPRIHNVLLLPTPLASPYWGKVQELRDAVVDFRRSGKKVVAFLEFGSDREYYLASAADRVVLLPTSPLDLTGVASYDVFLRGTLDRLGVYPDFLHVGEYKTAVNQFTETGFTPQHREMSESLNRDMYAQLVSGIAQARRKSEADVQTLLDQGPFTPEEALRAGLVDDLAYDDQLDDRMRELRIASGEMQRIDGEDYARVSPAAVGIQPRSRIAVIYAVGTIVSGRSTFDPVNGTLLGSDTMVEQIRRARDDESIRAIIVRIDSPGGSSVASDVIWRELSITRDQEPSRPLIASMSDLAASGGYYIAMPAQAIVAQPGTLTGSIGVFMGKMVLAGTAAKAGISTETVASGRNASIYSPFAPFTPEQRDQLGRYMQGFYDNFVEKAAQSRKITPERIHAVAQGRVWTGRQAREHGLVDALGGLDRAVALAKERAKIPADEEVELVAFPVRRSFYEALAEQLGRASGGVAIWAALGDAFGAGDALAATMPARLFRRGEPLALMPVVVR